ncbi:hypothetical protein AVEN_20734-1 [Araneus ventricosus]|uniref:Uncharacterized protein n=1 Tax=Araneus ventricosus TaxID=182803 RepID=A0A4Y2UJR3_ARAVE|nr:hypothetical protein AVEN_20734-1 [Araneus ventricosus]
MHEKQVVSTITRVMWPIAFDYAPQPLPYKVQPFIGNVVNITTQLFLNCKGCENPFTFLVASHPNRAAVVRSGLRGRMVRGPKTDFNVDPLGVGAYCPLNHT